MLIKMPLFSISTLVKCPNHVNFYALDMVRRILLLIQLCMSTCIQIKTYFLLTGVCVETVAPCPRSRKMSAVQRQHRQYLHTQSENQFVLIMVYFILILCDTVAFIVCNTLQVTRRLLEVEGNLKCMVDHPGLEPVCLNVYSLQNACQIYRADYGPLRLRGIHQYVMFFLNVIIYIEIKCVLYSCFASLGITI